MGIDIFAKWQEQTDRERREQAAEWLLTSGGQIGYLREAYHGEPYATQYLWNRLGADKACPRFRLAVIVKEKPGILDSYNLFMDNTLWTNPLLASSASCDYLAKAAHNESNVPPFVA